MSHRVYCTHHSLLQWQWTRFLQTAAEKVKNNFKIFCDNSRCFLASLESFSFSRYWISKILVRKSFFVCDWVFFVLTTGLFWHKWKFQTTKYPVVKKVLATFPNSEHTETHCRNGCQLWIPWEFLDLLTKLGGTVWMGKRESGMAIGVTPFGWIMN